MKVDDVVKVKSCSAWGDRMVQKYGTLGKVGKIGKENVMIVNLDCVSLHDETFMWGYWLHMYEATLEVL